MKATPAPGRGRVRVDVDTVDDDAPGRTRPGVVILPQAPGCLAPPGRHDPAVGAGVPPDVGATVAPAVAESLGAGVGVPDAALAACEAAW